MPFKQTKKELQNRIAALELQCTRYLNRIEDDSKTIKRYETALARFEEEITCAAKTVATLSNRNEALQGMLTLLYYDTRDLRGNKDPNLLSLKKSALKRVWEGIETNERAQASSTPTQDSKAFSGVPPGIYP